MGLDMYLTAKYYVSKYHDEKLHTDINELTKDIRNNWEINYVEMEAMYWRKCNQIHNWFVKNVQNGVDDCRETYVSKEDLIDLYNVVCEVLNDHSKAEELLPTGSGFFFGSTDYDEYYFGDLEVTKEELEKILAKDNIDEYSFYYRSSW